MVFASTVTETPKEEKEPPSFPDGGSFSSQSVMFEWETYVNSVAPNRSVSTTTENKDCCSVNMVTPFVVVLPQSTTRSKETIGSFVSRRVVNQIVGEL